jgi:hypothetical protein
VTVLAGPTWIWPGVHTKDGASTLLVAPPAVEEDTTYEISLRAIAQWADDPESRQTLRVTVRPVPRITSVRRSGKKLYVYGAHLDLSGLKLAVAGAPVTPYSVRPTRMKVRLASSFAAEQRGKRVSVELRDPSTGVRSESRVRF